MLVVQHMSIRPLPSPEITQAIIGAGIVVHKETGPGLLESIYRKCLVIELRLQGFQVETEVSIPFTYKGTAIDSNLRADIIVNDCVLVEVKAVESILPIHQAQVITYLKLAAFSAGLIMNFNVKRLTQGVRRVVHPDLYLSS